MRGLLLATVTAGVLALLPLTANAAPRVDHPGLHNGGASVVKVDWYWGHRHWHHRRWHHGRWHYWD